MKIVFVFLFFSHALFAFTLKEKFQKGEMGAYVVTEQNRVNSLLHLHTIEKGRILLEEISIPSHLTCHTDWKKWVKDGAHGHTAWVLYEIDLNKDQVIECYSVSRKAWIPIEDVESFFLSLLSLKLKYLPDNQRINNASAGDACRPWCPPQILHSKKIRSPEYDVYTAIWPRGNGNFSGKNIVLYFDKMRDAFPFPYWIHLYKGVFKFSIRAIDSGVGLSSPITDIPRRMPTFVGGIREDAHQLSFSLNIPAYYDSFSLYAIDITEKNSRSTYTISFEVKKRGENVTLFVDKIELASHFSKGHEYLWLFASTDPDTVVECPQMFRWIAKEESLVR